MAERYGEWERRRRRDVDEEADPYYRGGRGRDYRRLRNDDYGTGYQGRPERREYGPQDDYVRSDYARSDRPDRYGRSDYGREPIGEPYDRGDYARSDRPERYGRGEGERRFQEPYRRGDYARGDYRQGEVRGRAEERYGRQRGMRDYGREPYDYGPQQGYGQPTTWSYTEYWMIPGPYTGTGPSGYQRSDERILEDVCERMTRHGYLDAGNIEVEANDGIVTLRGTVDSRRTKRMAEDTAESVAGVWDIDNRLTVRRGGEEEQEQVETPQS